jgi:hypothetical protein
VRLLGFGQLNVDAAWGSLVPFGWPLFNLVLLFYINACATEPSEMAEALSADDTRDYSPLAVVGTSQPASAQNEYKVHKPQLPT